MPNYEQVALYGGGALLALAVVFLLVKRYRASVKAEREEWERLGKVSDERRQRVSDFLS